MRPSTRRLDEQRAVDVLVPVFEQRRRLAACEACEQFAAVRCPLVQLGCKGAYERNLWSTRGACPADRWPSCRVPWITTAELAAAAIELADLLPADVTRIVGVPRSGMIPGAVIASKLHLPLYTIRDWQVVPAGGGFRTGWGVLNGDGGRWAFIDDTLHNGATFRTLREHGIPLDQHVTAVAYARDPAQCDLHVHQLETPHLLEWNLLNTAYMQHLATDLDGIVCHNPPRQEVPRFLPRAATVGAIISARPEAERQWTVDWLARYGVRYRSLRLWQGTEVDRWDVERVAEWKARESLAAGAEFYIESEPSLADAIRRQGLRVLCPAQGYLE